MSSLIIGAEFTSFKELKELRKVSYASGKVKYIKENELSCKLHYMYLQKSNLAQNFFLIFL